MLVDFHTHAFPPDVAERRQHYLDTDATFAELYAEPRARLSDAEDLLRSMQRDGIDRSVALGFAWSDLDTCRLHNDYLLESAAASAGALQPFCSLPLACSYEAIEAEARRCVEGGAPGFGELRPDNLGFDLGGEDGRFLGELIARLGAVLLFHVTEPVGHAYAGKHGLSLAALGSFIANNPQVRVVAAHWGGGLPFFALMPEVRAALGNTWFDTAASSLLYEPDVYRRVAELVGAERILFGSDYPLLGQRRCSERVAEAGLTPAQQQGVMGGNAAALLGLT